jgi:hypothetical protein
LPGYHGYLFFLCSQAYGAYAHGMGAGLQAVYLVSAAFAGNSAYFGAYNAYCYKSCRLSVCRKYFSFNGAGLRSGSQRT